MCAPKARRLQMRKHMRFIRWFEDVGIDDVALVGGKTASIGEMYRQLTPQGVRIPNGFAITAEAYRELLARADLVPQMRVVLGGLDRKDLEDFARRGHRLRELVYQAPFPGDLAQEIRAAYGELCGQY